MSSPKSAKLVFKLANFVQDKDPEKRATRRHQLLATLGFEQSLTKMAGGDEKNSSSSSITAKYTESFTGLSRPVSVGDLLCFVTYILPT